MVRPPPRRAVHLGSPAASPARRRSVARTAQYGDRPGLPGARVYLAGAYAAEADLGSAAAAQPGREDAGWLRERLAQSAPLLTGLSSLSDVAATLASRLPDAPAGVDSAQLSPLLHRPYLTPIWGPEQGAAWRRVF